jgi:hypothetical protein
MDRPYSHFSNFLKDEKFIRWQLMPDDELNEYWTNFIRENPELETEIQQAVAYLKNNVLNKSKLSEDERVQLLYKIQSTLKQNKRRTKIRRFIQYGAVACIAAALLFSGLNYKNFGNKSLIANGEEQIVGNLLKNKDIQLIAGDELYNYQNNIEVKISEKGTAKILQSGNSKQEQIKISQSSFNKLIVPYGKRTQLNLSDGTKVWLNSGSVLEFPTRFTEKNREIRLYSGEIYLEVAHNKNKSFIVHTSNFNVKVYGTKFNVSVYSDSPHSVVLVEGRVGLNSVRKSSEIKMVPNELAVYSGNGIFRKQKVDVDQYVSWKNGYLSFDNTPMSEVLKQIGRYYNLSFNYDKDVNLQKRTCSGKIYLSDNLDNVMTTIAILSSTRYEKQNNQIYIVNN